MKMCNKKGLFFVTILLIFMVGCAGLMEKWKALTPDQKARTTIDFLQEELDNHFDVTKAYVDANPDLEQRWKDEGVPAFDLANKAIKDIIDLGQLEELTPDQVRAKVMPFINKVIAFMVKLGIIE